MTCKNPGCTNDCENCDKPDPALVNIAIAAALPAHNASAYTNESQQASVDRIAAELINSDATDPPSEVEPMTGTRIAIPLVWSFKGAVAKNFDAHVNSQLPFYQWVSEMVSFMANQFLPKAGRMYDIGCSTGNITARIRLQLEAKSAAVINIDSENDILKQFHGHGELKHGYAQDEDYHPFDVATMMLTMGFIPVAERVALLSKLYANLKPGGAIIMVEKFRPRTVVAQEVFRRSTLYFKHRNENANDTLAKEFSLGGILVPVDVSIFEAAKIPSTRIESFFQFGEFAGWIIFGEPV